MRRVLALGGGDAAGAEADKALAARVVVAHAAAEPCGLLVNPLTTHVAVVKLISRRLADLSEVTQLAARAAARRSLGEPELVYLDGRAARRARKLRVFNA